MDPLFPGSQEMLLPAARLGRPINQTACAQIETLRKLTRSEFWALCSKGEIPVERHRLFLLELAPVMGRRLDEIKREEDGT